MAGIVAVLLGLAGLAASIGAWTWLAVAAMAVAGGFAVPAAWRSTLVLSLIPATLMTNSAVVPYAGRYVPAVTVIGALAVAHRTEIGRIRTQVADVPTWLRRLLIAWVAWMAITTLTSTEREVSAAYVVGSAITLAIAFVVIPSLPRRSELVRNLVATLVVTAVVIVLSGVVFALVGSFQAYGRAVGLYFVTEFTLFGHPTGVILIQDYGPFIGPETTPLALGLVGALYLQSRTAGRARLVWIASAAVILIGLISTFSREGWLIVVLACLALAIPGAASRVTRPALVTAGVMLVFFVAGISNTLGVLGRMDLVARWYGPNAASVLLNPNVTQRGQSPSGPTPVATGPVQQRTLREPCVSVEAPGAAPGTPSNPTVELKGSSSLLARVCLWETALRAMAHRPLFGFGPGSGADAIVPYFYGKSAGLSGATTHDTYLRVGVEMGVPGLAIYLALSALAAWIAFGWLRRRAGRAEVVLAAGILAITVAELTDTLLFGGLSFPGFWLAMSVGLLAVPERSDVASTTNGRTANTQTPAVRAQAGISL